MNILLISNKYPSPPRDGGSLATFNMARGLSGAGNRVDILAMKTSKHFSTPEKNEAAVPGANQVSAVYVDTSVRYTGLLRNFFFSSFPYNAERFISDDFSAKLANLLNENQYDIIQMEGLYLLPYIPVIRANSSAILVYRAHNVEYLIWRSYYLRENNFLKKFYLGKLYKRILNLEQSFLNSYDLIVPITRLDLDQLNSMGNDKPYYIAPFGMYSDELPEYRKPETDDISLQYIGALDWMPNIDGLNWFIDKVWNQLKSYRRGLVFRVAGRNANKDYARYLVKNGIDFWGEVGNAGEYLSQNGILIVPLFAGSGIRVKIIEAMFMGKPVITTSFAVSGIPVEHGKHMLLADNENAFAEAVVKLLDDPGYAYELGKNAKLLAQRHFNNTDITKGLSAFYKKYAL